MVEDAAELTGLGEECVVAARARQIDQLRRSAQVSGEKLELLARHDRVAFGRDDDGRRSDGARIDVVQVAGQRQRQKTRRRPSFGEAMAVLAKVALHRKEGVVRGEYFGGGVEPFRELDAATVRGNRQFARDGQRVVRPIRGKPEPNDATLNTAERGAHRVRLVRGADGDDAIEAVRVSLSEGESDHSAVGRADERVETRDVRCVEHACDRIGLVGSGHGSCGLAIGATAAVEKIDAENAERVCVDGSTGTDDGVPPSMRRIVLSRSDVARRRNPAEDRDDWRAGRADDLESRQVVTRIRKRSVLKTWCFLKQRHLHVPRDTLAEKKKPPVLI